MIYFISGLIIGRLRRLRISDKIISIINKFERPIFRRDLIACLIGVTQKPKVKPYWVEQVYGAQNPISEIDKFVAESKISLQAAGELLTKVMTDRSHVVHGFAMQDRTNLKNSELTILRDIYQREFSGDTYAIYELTAAWNQLTKSEYHATKANELYFLLSAIKVHSIETAVSIFKGANSICPHDLPSTHKIGLLRLMRAKQPEEYLGWREKLELTPLEELKVVEIDADSGIGVVTDHKTIVSNFKRIAPTHLRDELEVDILSFYEKFDRDLVWMDCRLDYNKRRKFIEMIKSRIVNQEPWSLIRLGDGESYAWQCKLSKETVETRERIWWGHSIEPELRDQISNVMYEAIKAANVLGIPSVFRFIRDTHHSLRSYSAHISISGLVTVLEGLKEMPKSDRKFTEDRIHQVCFDIDTVAEIAALASKIIVVSSVKENVLRPIFSGIEGKVLLEVISIPTHSKTSHNDSYESDGLSLPYVYKNVQARIETSVEPGVLVIIAAGLIGKIFCESTRKHGGVAIDVGAMADYWIGVKTRSIADII